MALLRTIRAWFARVGSDPYYASYERSFAVAYAAILAWAAYVNRQPPGTYTQAQQAARVAPTFLAPLIAWLAHRLLGWLQRLLDRRGAARAKQLEAKLRKQVTELKDSTRYDRTLALLQKYDPDYAPPKPQPARSARQGATAGQQQSASASTPGGLPARAAGAAGSALQGAGSRLFPLLGQLYSQAAGTLIADDPVMLGLLRDAQQQSDLLRQRLVDAETRAIALLQANIMLKQQLGLPVEEEQAALAAWTGTPGGTAGGGGDQPEAADSAAPEGTQGAENESVAQAEDEGHAADAGSVGEDCTVDQGQGAAAAARSPVGALSEQGAAPGSRVTRRKRGGS
ncbi:hypothetical protein ABPG77_007391 [Micractinium sp. CCAP 211/92]